MRAILIAVAVAFAVVAVVFLGGLVSRGVG